ncbi:carbon storage regulator RsmA [Legionella quinlivanii]|uniref:Translational regulator CsrA n=1 Tax=Legionella quinlivanii TaxID=45073 RepID=A0A0W0XS21_9GAMM|nr:MULTISPECIES: carbon storage regulator [Legionella]KTD47435.1 carbon storage regulator RsmA [Legionella quinlivanii]MCE3043678.1 carbon storage regulator [Legionella sp. 16cNR16C]SEG42045.1 carbon storage regulator, CsrA [Legionella quinlivanii DSM 21216]SEG46270.1 carbon storage regulator, CsrA [Legionella quinlivanii DSM 21216]STY49844.1 carbon storage regulator RsmA [Legionella quinlivanii]
MLILSRKVGESIMVMNEICITILKNVDGKVDVGISAPKSMAVHRLEIFEKNKAREIKD